MMSRSPHRIAALAPWLLIGAFAPLVLAQPEGAPPPAPRQAEPAPEHDRLRGILERRLERSREQAERLEKAISMLDEGATSEDLREEFRDLFFDRDGRPDRDGEPGEKPRDFDPDHADDEDSRDRGPRRFSPEDRERFLEFLRVEFPDLHQRVTEVIPGGPEGPAEIDERVERRLRPLIELMRLKEADPEMFSLRRELWAADRRAWEAARGVREAAGADREKAVADLRDVLEAQFDLQLKVHRLELERLEARLAKARQEAADQASLRDELVNERLMEVISRAESPPRERRRDRAGRPD